MKVRELLRKAHHRGLRVFLDIMVGYCEKHGWLSIIRPLDCTKWAGPQNEK
jgi:hypothetical protein